MQRYGAPMRIERVVDAETLARGSELFDDLPRPAASSGSLMSLRYHLLFAWDDAYGAVGFVSCIEVTHPDKGTEMFLYELGSRGSWLLAPDVATARRLTKMPAYRRCCHRKKGRYEA
jgi:hypothetical protein